MKKSKLSVGLVASFIGSLALSACSTSSDVVSKQGQLVSITDYNGDEIIIKTDDIYGKYSDSSDGTKLYYDAILEALIRYEYPELSRQNLATLRSYETLLSEAEDKYQSARQTANDNADTNGTSFDAEWEKILESHNCENNEDLKQYYLYNLEKEELSDWYAKNNIDSLKDEYLGLDKEYKPIAEGKKVENVQALYPYHILHVLVKLSASGTDYNRGTITEAEATKLWQVVRNLIDEQYSFEDVAHDLSDDTSKDQYGDVGIMSTKTSFYNEFKLGIYAYDAILSKQNTLNDDTRSIYEAFGLNKEGSGTDVSGAYIVKETTSTGIETEFVADAIQKEMVDNVKTPVSLGSAYTTIPTVPYQVFKLIGDAAKKETLKGLAPESGDVVLPRNILFNQFLNFHSPFVITAEDITDNDTIADDKVAVAEHNFSDNTAGNLYIPNNNFEEMNVNGALKKVLCDKKGNVIIGVRSEAGIHFMIMRKSVFYNTNHNIPTSATTTKADVSLQDYYTTLIPGEEGYPASGETYVNIKKTDDQSFYKGRADTIKEALKSSDFDAAYDYRLYEYLTSNSLVAGKIHFSNETVEENINEYIKLLRETKVIGDGTSINDSWQTYILALRYQNTVRSMNNSLVHTTCAFKFTDANAAEFKKGGACYVEK